MADNNTAEVSAAAASQPAEAPVQPTTAHQPVGQPAANGHQSVQYAQYPNAYGQQYQPYQQYGYQQNAQQNTAYQPNAGYQQNAGYYSTPYPQAMSAGQPAETKFWINAKMALHGTSIVFSIITLGMGLSLISGPVDVSFLAAVACPLPIMSLIWSSAELIVRAVHKFQSGIHPGGHVAATLIIWLAAAIVGAMQAIYGVTTDGYCDYDYDPDYGYTETDDCHDPWSGRLGLWYAITTFSCLLWLIFFTLFVMACIDTSRRNAAKRVVMVMNPANYWGPQAQGWQQMPQQNSQYMTVPEAAARGTTDIPLQNRASSPGTPYETPMENPINEKGKEPEQPAHGLQEYYGSAR